jgi:hypothetical protein
MSIAEVLGQMEAWTTEERQQIIRRALVLDEPGLSGKDVRIVEERLRAHEVDPASSLSLDQAVSRLRTQFPA